MKAVREENDKSLLEQGKGAPHFVLGGLMHKVVLLFVLPVLLLGSCNKKSASLTLNSRRTFACSRHL